jgi:hypothetical protein
MPSDVESSPVREKRREHCSEIPLLPFCYGRTLVVILRISSSPFHGTAEAPPHRLGYEASSPLVET